MNVVQAINAVMNDVQGIAKRERNQTQGFNFRGIDATINAVGPALREHGVIFVPLAETITAEQYETTKGTTMRNVVVRVRWSIYGPDGDHIEACTYGEAADAGDKAISKAHSVAYRTCLLQTLCIPTDEPDPDASVHERSNSARVPAPSPLVEARTQAWHAAQRRHPELNDDQLGDLMNRTLREQGLNGSDINDIQKLINFFDQEPTQ